jgi:hypothetical protein
MQRIGLLAAFSMGLVTACVTPKFSGLDMSLGTLPRLSHAETRAISPENFTGGKGAAAQSTNGPAWRAARDLGQGWKVSPFVNVPAQSTVTLADIAGSGAIQQIWMTPAPLDKTRLNILRCYWDGETSPSVEVPLGDFFACGWGKYCQINSMPVCVNPGSAFNCYWVMPFRKGAKITLENLDGKPMRLYYQIHYALTKVPDDAATFHAQFRRVPRVQDDRPEVTILDGVRGKGHYVGTYLAWEVRDPGWWGEGEMKFFLDGDTTFPTICGTGTEDYFCGSYNFENQETKRYQTFSTPHSGLAQVLPPDVIYRTGQRFGLYRWHVADPIRFTKDLKVTIQTLGWMKDKSGRYLPLHDDVASVAYWYQDEPHAPFPALPPPAMLKVGPLQVTP